MPSIRLLSIVHHSLKPGQRIRWIPWQLRLSQKQYQEAMEAKATKPLRTEAQLLSAALFDDTPEMTLQQGAVNGVQKPFRNAWALAAHLHNLKAFDKKVAELCLQHFDQDLGLRSPNMQELLAADRKIWKLISELYSQNWSLDDALYERCQREGQSRAQENSRLGVRAATQERQRPRWQALRQARPTSALKARRLARELGHGAQGQTAMQTLQQSALQQSKLQVFACVCSEG